MKFKELPKKYQDETLAEITQYFIDEGETEDNAYECAKGYLIDKEFELVDYSADEDGTDIRVEW